MSYALDHLSRPSQPAVALRPQPRAVVVDTTALLTKWFFIALVLRVTLTLVIHTTGIDRSWELTKDGFLYADTANEMANYWRTGGATAWPYRVSSVFWDCLYEYELGILYYVFGDCPLLCKLFNSFIGSLTPLVIWRTALLVFNNHAIARRALVWSVLFPSSIYYSCLLVRDSQAMLATSLVFMGLAALCRLNMPVTAAWALCSGLLLTAGFRFYVFAILLGLIPFACLLTSFISGQNRGRYIMQLATVGMILGTFGAIIGVQSAVSDFTASEYTDLNFINHVRDKLNRGNGAMFGGSDAPDIGTDVGSTASGLLVGMYYFFFSVNPAEVNSFRQMMAIPEVLIVLLIAPSLIRGIQIARKHFLSTALPFLIVTFGITGAYALVATNAGPMLRWRLQIVGCYIILAAAGWTVKVARRKAARGAMAGVAR